MNDEIKEILKEIESYENDKLCLIILSQEQNKALLDYITNLQQENDDLKNRLENAVADCKLRLQENERLKQTQYVWSYDLDMQLEDYKSRCEKAIEYLKSYNTDFEHCRFNEAPISLRELGDLLNILQNGSDEK